jgi:hypothetical protein
LILVKIIAKNADLGSKRAGVSSDFLGKLHDCNESFHWKEAFYRPLLYKEKNHCQ